MSAEEVAQAIVREDVRPLVLQHVSSNAQVVVDNNVQVVVAKIVEMAVLQDAPANAI